MASAALNPERLLCARLWSIASWLILADIECAVHVALPKRHVYTFKPVHRGAFCQFPFRWIYYYGSNKSTVKEIGKMYLCVVQQSR